MPTGSRHIHPCSRSRSPITFSTRTAAVMMSALLAVGSIGLADATTAPRATAVDFYGAGAAECPAALATRGEGLGFVTAMGGARTYSTDIDLGIQTVSAAWLRAPRTSHTVAGEAQSSSAGYMVTDKSGSAYFVRQADNGMLLSTTKTKISGPWKGLRAVVGVTTSGRFMRIEAPRKGRVTLRYLARSGFSGLRDFVTDQCWQDGSSDAWIVRGKNDSLAR